MFSSHHRKWSCVLYLTLISAMFLMHCGGSKLPGWGDSETGYILTYRNKKGDILHYRGTRHGTNSSERGGQSYESDNEKKFVCHLTTEKIDSLIHFILTVDTLEQFFEGPQGRMEFNFGDIQGRRARVKFTPRGIQREITAIDSIPFPEMMGRRIEGGGNPAIHLTVGFFQIPDRPMKVGDSWTESRKDTTTRIDTTQQVSTTTIMERETQYTVLAEEMKRNLSCLHIKAESTFSTETSGTTRGMEISSEGDGETTSEVWFAYKKGLLIEYSLTTFAEGTSAMLGQMSMTMPYTNESHAILMLTKFSPKRP